MSTTTVDRARPAAARGGRAVRDTRVVMRRNLRAMRRQPQLVTFAVVQPVMLVLLFNFVFGGSIGQVLPPGIEYIDYLLPGVLVLVVAFGTGQTAVGMSQDLTQGMIDRFRSLPMARSAVLGGRVLADVVRLSGTVLLVTGVGALLGWRSSEGVLPALAGFVVVVAFGLAMSWIAAWIGMSVRDPETAQIAGLIWLFPLVFVSSAFLQIETFDPWLEAFARWNPITIFVDLARGLVTQAPFDVTSDLWWKAGGWLVVILGVFAPLAVRQYRRVS